MSASHGSVVLLLCLYLSAVRAHYVSSVLQVESHDSSQDMEINLSIMYNKENFLKVNGTERKVIGYTEYGIKWAEILNKNLHWLDKLIEKVRSEMGKFREAFETYVKEEEKPKVVLKLVRKKSTKQPAFLWCSAYNYYPRGINMTWIRDGEVMTSGVTFNGELSGANWKYQMQSYVEYTPGKIFSCMVQHQSLPQPETHTWDSSFSVCDKIMIGFGTSILLVGIITAVIGGFCYCRAADRTEICFTLIGFWKAQII